jgi:hypothetical protein
MKRRSKKWRPTQTVGGLFIPSVFVAQAAETTMGLAHGLRAADHQDARA